MMHTRLICISVLLALSGCLGQNSGEVEVAASTSVTASVWLHGAILGLALGAFALAVWALRICIKNEKSLREHKDSLNRLGRYLNELRQSQQQPQPYIKTTSVQEKREEAFEAARRRESSYHHHRDDIEANQDVSRLRQGSGRTSRQTEAQNKSPDPFLGIGETQLRDDASSVERNYPSTYSPPGIQRSRQAQHTRSPLEQLMDRYHQILESGGGVDAMQDLGERVGIANVDERMHDGQIPPNFDAEAWGDYFRVDLDSGPVLLPNPRLEVNAKRIEVLALREVFNFNPTDPDQDYEVTRVGEPAHLRTNADGTHTVQRKGRLTLTPIGR